MIGRRRYDEAVMLLRRQGCTGREIALRLGISVSTVYAITKRNGLSGASAGQPSQSPIPTAGAIERAVTMIPRDKIAETAIRLWDCVQIEAGLNGGFIATILAAEWSATGEEADCIQQAVWSAVASAMRQRLTKGVHGAGY